MAIGDEQQTAMVGLAFCNDQESQDKLKIVICSNFIVHLHYTNIHNLRATAHAADPKLEAWNQWQLS